jgi:hypothetical protein
MKHMHKIFKVFLALTLVMAVSYCCCIKHAMAKPEHSCCPQKNDQTHKTEDCPKIVSSFGNQSFDIVYPQLMSLGTLPLVSHLALSLHKEIPAVAKSPPDISSTLPLYIKHSVYRI